MQTIKEYEQKNQVKLIPKTHSRLMRFAALIMGQVFVDNFWTTYRLPFQKVPTITYPPRILDPLSRTSTLEHEMIHVQDLRRPFAPIYMGLLVFIFPLPILFSGRWFVERKAYLQNIIHHGYNIEHVVDTLWHGYAWCWPRSLMRRWFEKELERSKTNGNTKTTK